MPPTTEKSRSTILQGSSFALEVPELKVGDTETDFEAVDSSLKAVDLAKTGNGVRIFSVIPSLDTPVCNAQTKKFEDSTQELPGVSIYTVSTDLPFAQKRWCGSFGVKHVTMLSDHKDTSFGKNYGTLIRELRIESRAIFVIDKENKIRYVEYVGKVGDHPDYDAALAAAKSLA